MSQAVLIAVGIEWDGRRQILAVEWPIARAARPGRTSSRALKARPQGVEVVSDDHAGLVAAIGEVIPEARRRRYYLHFLRNALDHLTRKRGDDCLEELCWPTTRAISPRPRLISSHGCPSSRDVIPDCRLGWRSPSTYADLLPPAAPAPQAPQVHQYA
ncbi:transposase [Mesorhizobium sp. M0923]|uniref:transposase n=1 Tax=unclassified Mesorhizobium TaxID=325217 RepID=UPI00333D9EDE